METVDSSILAIGANISSYHRFHAGSSMKILVIGGGGREHAIGWRLAQSGHQIFAAPGNPGLASVGKLLPTNNYLAAAEQVNADLTVVGPEAPLVAGVVYCDGRIIDQSTSDQILNLAIRPVIERTGFTGFLYAGLMMTADGPKVLEYNVRLGDPETQPLMHRLDCDFGEILMAAATGELAAHRLTSRNEPSVCLVLAAHGYPGTVRTRDRISGIDAAEALNAQVFQAGTRIGSNGLETAGGRVLGVTARGSDLAGAINNVYAAAAKIHFDGMQYRTDIGRKGLKRW
jgi:phosphoribosylamine-glycine ligase